jgi:putative ABC transport system substrate-binding protein
MGRKILLWLLGTVLLITASIVEAQQAKKIPRIGYLSSRRDLRDEAFRQGLRERGYLEGKNISIEYRVAKDADQLSELAAELVRLQVDVIVTTGTPETLAAKRVTTTIPIVMLGIGDPVRSGLVDSLARPGGNITGSSALSPELSGKRLELLKETFPKVSRVAILWNSDNPAAELNLKETQVAAQALGLKHVSLQCRNVSDLDKALLSIARENADALVLVRGLGAVTHTQIADLGAKSRLPAIYPATEFADAGGLMAYGISAVDLYRRGATYVDKILKGVKPTDLPIEQPTKFELVINLKTAKQIGLTIPQKVLLKADRVIK